MQCPFLSEGRVRSCERAGIRTAIRAGHAEYIESCSSSAYTNCRVYIQNSDAASSAGLRCPYATESDVQYCAAAAPRKTLFCQESAEARCEKATYRYCDVYLEKTRPNASGQIPLVDGILVPRRLFYSPNHMWLDLFDDGWCVLGLDALFVRSLGSINRVVPIGTPGPRCPAALVWANGGAFEMVFPNPVDVVGCNGRVRVGANRVAADPYGSGWLIEAKELGGSRQRSATSGLIPGAEALEWMRCEIEQLRRFCGGRGELGTLESLPAAERRQIVNEFFCNAAIVRGSK